MLYSEVELFAVIHISFKNLWWLTSHRLSGWCLLLWYNHMMWQVAVKMTLIEGILWLAEEFALAGVQWLKLEISCSEYGCHTLWCFFIWWAKPLFGMWLVYLEVVFWNRILYLDMVSLFIATLQALEYKIFRWCRNLDVCTSSTMLQNLHLLHRIGIWLIKAFYIWVLVQRCLGVALFGELKLLQAAGAEFCSITYSIHKLDVLVLLGIFRVPNKWISDCIAFTHCWFKLFTH